MLVILIKSYGKRLLRIIFIRRVGSLKCCEVNVANNVSVKYPGFLDVNRPGIFDAYLLGMEYA